SAGEFFSITSDKEVALYGIEDKPLYMENVEQFKKIRQINESTKKDITNLTAALDGLKSKIYSPDMMSLDKNSILHKDGKLSFSDRWELINNLASKSGVKYQQYENLTKLVESLELEKGMDFQKANKERDALIDTLSKSMPKQDLEQLVLKSLSFKQSKISQGEYYVFLQELARRYGVDPEPYKLLIAYTDYITLYESIDLIEIFEEVRNFEDSVKEKLFENSYQRRLHDFSRIVSLVGDLYELKLTNGDVEELTSSLRVPPFLQKGRDEAISKSGIASSLTSFAPRNDERSKLASAALRPRNDGLSKLASSAPRNDAEALAAFIKDASLKYGVAIEGNYDLGNIFDNIQPALLFYKTAEERNSAMLANTINDMQRNGQSVAALVTGGYHSKGLTKLLRERETSYVIILPKFDSSKDERPYVAILTNKKEPYEKLLESGDYYLATTSLFAGEENFKNPIDIRRFVQDIVIVAMAQARLKGADEQSAAKTWIDAFAARQRQLKIEGKEGLTTPAELEGLIKSVEIDIVEEDGVSYAIVSVSHEIKGKISVSKVKVVVSGDELGIEVPTSSELTRVTAAKEILARRKGKPASDEGKVRIADLETRVQRLEADTLANYINEDAYAVLFPIFEKRFQDGNKAKVIADDIEAKLAAKGKALRGLEGNPDIEKAVNALVIRINAELAPQPVPATLATPVPIVVEPKIVPKAVVGQVTAPLVIKTEIEGVPSIEEVAGELNKNEMILEDVGMEDMPKQLRDQWKSPGKFVFISEGFYSDAWVIKINGETIVLKLVGGILGPKALTTGMMKKDAEALIALQGAKFKGRTAEYRGAITGKDGKYIAVMTKCVEAVTAKEAIEVNPAFKGEAVSQIARLLNDIESDTGLILWDQNPDNFLVQYGKNIIFIDGGSLTPAEKGASRRDYAQIAKAMFKDVPAPKAPAAKLRQYQYVEGLALIKSMIAEKMRNIGQDKAKKRLFVVIDGDPASGKTYIGKALTKFYKESLKTIAVAGFDRDDFFRDDYLAGIGYSSLEDFQKKNGGRDYAAICNYINSVNKTGLCILSGIDSAFDIQQDIGESGDTEYIYIEITASDEVRSNRLKERYAQDKISDMLRLVTVQCFKSFVILRSPPQADDEESKNRSFAPSGLRMTDARHASFKAELLLRLKHQTFGLLGAPLKFDVSLSTDGAEDIRVEEAPAKPIAPPAPGMGGVGFNGTKFTKAFAAYDTPNGISLDELLSRIGGYEGLLWGLQEKGRPEHGNIIKVLAKLNGRQIAELRQMAREWKGAERSMPEKLEAALKEMKPLEVKPPFITSPAPAAASASIKVRTEDELRRAIATEVANYAQLEEEIIASGSIKGSRASLLADYIKAMVVLCEATAKNRRDMRLNGVYGLPSMSFNGKSLNTAMIIAIDMLPKYKWDIARRKLSEYHKMLENLKGNPAALDENMKRDLLVTAKQATVLAALLPGESIDMSRPSYITKLPLDEVALFHHLGRTLDVVIRTSPRDREKVFRGQMAIIRSTYEIDPEAPLMGEAYNGRVNAVRLISESPKNIEKMLSGSNVAEIQAMMDFLREKKVRVLLNGKEIDPNKIGEIFARGLHFQGRDIKADGTSTIMFAAEAKTTKGAAFTVILSNKELSMLEELDQLVDEIIKERTSGRGKLFNERIEDIGILHDLALKELLADKTYRARVNAAKLLFESPKNTESIISNSSKAELLKIIDFLGAHRVRIILDDKEVSPENIDKITTKGVHFKSRKIKAGGVSTISLTIAPDAIVHGGGIIPAIREIFNKLAHTNYGRGFNLYNMLLGPVIEEALFRGVPMGVAALAKGFGLNNSMVFAGLALAITASLISFIRLHPEGARAPPALIGIIASLLPLAFFLTGLPLLSSLSIIILIHAVISQAVITTSEIQMLKHLAAADALTGLRTRHASKIYLRNPLGYVLCVTGLIFAMFVIFGMPRVVSQTYAQALKPAASVQLAQPAISQVDIEEDRWQTKGEIVIGSPKGDIAIKDTGKEYKLILPAGMDRKDARDILKKSAAETHTDRVGLVIQFMSIIGDNATDSARTAHKPWMSKLREVSNTQKQLKSIQAQISDIQKQLKTLKGNKKAKTDKAISGQINTLTGTLKQKNADTAILQKKKKETQGAAKELELRYYAVLTGESSRLYERALICSKIVFPVKSEVWYRNMAYSYVSLAAWEGDRFCRTNNSISTASGISQILKGTVRDIIVRQIAKEPEYRKALCAAFGVSLKELLGNTDARHASLKDPEMEVASILIGMINMEGYMGRLNGPAPANWVAVIENRPSVSKYQDKEAAYKKYGEKYDEAREAQLNLWYKAHFRGSAVEIEKFRTAFPIDGYQAALPIEIQKERPSSGKKTEFIKLKKPRVAQAPVRVETKNLSEGQLEYLRQGIERLRRDHASIAVTINGNSVKIWRNMIELAAFQNDGIDLDEVILDNSLAITLSVYHEKLHDMLRGYRAREGIPQALAGKEPTVEDLERELIEEIFIVGKTLEYLYSDKVTPAERQAYLDFLKKDPAINNANFTNMAARYGELRQMMTTGKIKEDEFNKKVPRMIGTYAKKAFARDWNKQFGDTLMSQFRQAFNLREDARNRVVEGTRKYNDYFVSIVPAPIAKTTSAPVAVLQPPAPASTGREPDTTPLTETEKEFLAKSGKPYYIKGQVLAMRSLKDGVPIELRTGGGKSLIIAGAALLRYREKGERVLVMTHENNLTIQAIEKDKSGEILSNCGAVTGFIVTDDNGEEKGIIYENGVKRDASIEEVYDKCAIIYGKWDTFVHRHMRENLGLISKAMNANKHFALFDEADLILVFGSATPCIISGDPLKDSQDRLVLRRGLNDIVKNLVKDKSNYYIPAQGAARQAVFSEKGLKAIRAELKYPAEKNRAMSELVALNGELFAIDALRANLFYAQGEGRQLYVKNGKITVRDEHTGAEKTGMSFGEGMQQAIEIALGADEVTPETYTLSSETIVQFLRNNPVISDFAGASGTMATERFKEIYGKDVVHVEGIQPTLKKETRRGFDNKDEKKKALIESLKDRLAKNQPIFLKVEDDAEVRDLREYIEQNLRDELVRHGIIINELNGAMDRDAFSRALEEAGYANVITITTNIAHRGINITIKGRYLNKDGSERKDAAGAVVEVPPVGQLAPGLHVISFYFDDAEAFEVQTQGRADRGANQGSWEGLFSLDEKIFTEHAEALKSVLPALQAAVKKFAGTQDAKDGKEVERLIYKVRDFITSEQNRNDSKRRETEDEIFEYQKMLMNLQETVQSEASFMAFVELAVGGPENFAKMKDKLNAEALEEAMQVIRDRLLEIFAEFQTAQQNIRRRLDYRAQVASMGIELAQFQKELSEMTIIASRFKKAVEEAGDFAKRAVTMALGENVNEVTDVAKRRGASPILKIVGMVILALGASALLAIVGTQPIIRLLQPILEPLAGNTLALGVAAITLLIPSIYLRQRYGKKIAYLDTSMTDFMRHPLGIGKGSTWKAFGRWVSIMSLQLLAGPGLFAAAGTLITAIAYPAISILSLPVFSIALGAACLALISNIILVALFRGEFEKVREVEPGRFGLTLNSFVKSMVLTIGVLFVIQFAPRELAAIGIPLLAILASVLGSKFLIGKGEAQEMKWPARVGAIIGIAAGAGLIALSSLLGMSAIISPQAISLPIAAIGIMIMTMQSLTSWKIGAEAKAAGQSRIRALAMSLMPTSRNLIMYAISLPVIFFTGLSTALAFIGITMLIALAMYKYNVDIEKKVSQPVSKTLSSMLGQAVSVAAGATPMIVYPKAAYSEKMAAAFKANSQDEFIAAMRNIAQHPIKEGAGIKSLQGNISYIFQELMSGAMKLSPRAPIRIDGNSSSLKEAQRAPVILREAEGRPAVILREAEGRPAVILREAEGR
ncbi:MAG: hypothetical protein Q8O01_01770, partial [Candidatus Omnitrophota bacterium]|nr:hypothetical protein [Candidatus Omnitrophota bacterium]